MAARAGIALEYDAPGGISCPQALNLFSLVLMLGLTAYGLAGRATGPRAASALDYAGSSFSTSSCSRFWPWYSLTSSR